MKTEMPVGKAWSWGIAYRESMSFMDSWKTDTNKLAIAQNAIRDALAAISPYNGAFVGQQKITEQLQQTLKEIE